MRIAGLSVLAAAALVPGAAAPAPAADEVPFPVSKSTILRAEGTVYTVEGRIRIPKGVEVSCQKDVHVKAKGKGAAVIEVEGQFPVHGVDLREVIFEGVTVEPAEQHGEIHLEHCIFRKGGGLATPSGKAAAGDILVQACQFKENARVDLAVSGGTIQFLDSGLGGVLRIRGVDPPSGPNRVKATIRGSDSDGLELVNLADVTVRINRVRPGPALLRDNGVLIFDGNKVESKDLRFEQSKAGRFARTQVMKCDLYCDTVTFRAPVEAGKSDVVEVDKCWFQGKTARKDVEAVVRDADDDPTTGVKVTVRNPQERPLELAGAVIR